MIKIKQLIEGSKEDIEKYFADKYEWIANKDSDFAYENQMMNVPEKGHGIVVVVQAPDDPEATLPKVTMVHCFVVVNEIE